MFFTMSEPNVAKIFLGFDTKSVFWFMSVKRSTDFINIKINKYCKN